MKYLKNFAPIKSHQIGFEVICLNCKKPYLVQSTKMNQKYYCSELCKPSGSINNPSSWEIYLQKRIREDFPDCQILFNSNQKIGMELDIHFIDGKLAFEINGLHHYYPIYTNEIFQSQFARDRRKEVLCKQNQIKLIPIDISHLKKFNKLDAEKLYQEIKSILLLN